MKPHHLLGSILLTANLFAGAYSDGDASLPTGSSESTAIPIADKQDLIHLSNTPADWDKYFIQTSDIVFLDSISEDWDGDLSVDGSGTQGFDPIGDNGTTFDGVYDGGHHSITNLYINGVDTAGLFGATSSALIQNLILEDVYVRGLEYSGALIAHNRYSDISSIQVSGQVHGSGTYVAGIVADFFNGEVKDVHFEGEVVGANNVGGAFGRLYAADVTQSSVRADVTNTGTIDSTTWYYTGGFAASVGVNSDVDSSSFSGDILGKGLTGGFTGSNQGVITHSFSEGRITAFNSHRGSQALGGFVGMNVNLIENSYSQSDVSSSDIISIGGFAGLNTYGGGSPILIGHIQNCFANGLVKGTRIWHYAGGFGGSNTQGASILNSYATGASSADGASGFVNYNGTSSDIFNAYATGDVGDGNGFAGRNWQASWMTGAVYDRQTTGAGVETYDPYWFQEDSTDIRSLTTNGFKSDTFGDWGSNIASPGNGNNSQPWILNSSGRPYIYWQRFALSNSLTVGDTMSGHIIDVQPNDQVTIEYYGVRYKGVNSNIWEYRDIRDFAVMTPLVNGEAEVTVPAEVLTTTNNGSTYHIQLFLRDSEGRNHFGDMVEMVTTKRGQNLTIDFIDDKLITDADFQISGSSNSAYTVTFESLTPGVCSVSNDMVSLVSSGRCSIIGRTNSSVSWHAGSRIVSFQVSQLTQSISITGSLDSTYELSHAKVDLTGFAEASSGLDVSYTSMNSSVCTVSGEEITLVDIGLCQIEIAQAGDVQYQAATSVIVDFTVLADPSHLISQDIHNVISGQYEVFNLQGKPLSEIKVKGQQDLMRQKHDWDSGFYILRNKDGQDFKVLVQ